MTDIFKSAFGYIGNSNNQDLDFVGQNVELGDQKLRIRKLIAEGGFAYVFVAQDVKTNKQFALKRLLSSDQEKTKQIIQEITFLKKLSGHPNIIKFVSAASIGKEESGHGQAEFLILTELCSGGQIVDVLKITRYTITQVIHIFYQTCSAVHHMHKQKPPIIHRDLKVENLLLGDDGLLKLCDFGSATTISYYPDHSWSSSKRVMVEEEIEKNTTPMYRSPEMLDLYQNNPINEQADIWALGCVLFMLCFGQHPFEDSAKLRIINANFQIPINDSTFNSFHNLIKMMLKIHPMERPNIVDILEQLQEASVQMSINPESPIGLTPAPPIITPDIPLKSPRRDPPVNEAKQIGSQPLPSSGSSSGFGLFNHLKEGAAILVKNVKEASTKVVESVSQTMNRLDGIDISYITPRLCVMPFPGEGIDLRNNIDEVRTWLDAKHPNTYTVFNLSGRSYRAVKFHNRVSECGWKIGRAPSLNLLYSICHNMYTWLIQSPKNVCVVHCNDGRASSAMVIASFLMFCGLASSADEALLIFTKKRFPPFLSPSQTRYINYVSELINSDASQYRCKILELSKIVLNPVPLINKNKNGCRPFVEVLVDIERVLSTSQEYDLLSEFTSSDANVSLPVKCTLSGDVTIIVYHAQSSLGGKVQGKFYSRKIFEVQFNVDFLTSNNSVQYSLYDLDQVDNEERFSSSFTMTLFYSISGISSDGSGHPAALWANRSLPFLSPLLLVKSNEELQQMKYEMKLLNEVRDANSSKNLSSGTNKSSLSQQNNLQKKTVKVKSLLDTLEWQQPTESNASLPMTKAEQQQQFKQKVEMADSFEAEFEAFSVQRKTAPTDETNNYEALIDDAPPKKKKVPTATLR